MIEFKIAIKKDNLKIVNDLITKNNIEKILSSEEKMKGGFHLSGLELILLTASISNILRFALDIYDRLKKDDVVKMEFPEKKVIAISKDKTKIDLTNEIESQNE